MQYYKMRPLTNAAWKCKKMGIYLNFFNWYKILLSVEGVNEADWLRILFW